MVSAAASACGNEIRQHCWEKGWVFAHEPHVVDPAADRGRARCQHPSAATGSIACTRARERASSLSSFQDRSPPPHEKFLGRVISGDELGAAVSKRQPANWKEAKWTESGLWAYASQPTKIYERSFFQFACCQFAGGADQLCGTLEKSGRALVRRVAQDTLAPSPAPS